MWNEEHEGNNDYETLEFSDDFSITNEQHLTFLREQFDPINERQHISRILEYIREEFLYFWQKDTRSIIDIQKYYWEITSFLIGLDWLERNEELHESMWDLLNTKVTEILGIRDYQFSLPQISPEELAALEDAEEDLSHENQEPQAFEILSRLPLAWFSPIDNQARLLYSPVSLFPIAEYARTKIYYEEDGDEDTEVIIDRIGRVFEGATGHTRLIDSTRNILAGIQQALDVLETDNYDRAFTEQLVNDFALDETLLEIEDALKQKTDIVPILQWYYNIYQTLIDEESHKLRELYMRNSTPMSSKKTIWNTKKPVRKIPQLKIVRGE